MQPIVKKSSFILCKCKHCQREPKFLKHTYSKSIRTPNPRYIHNRVIIPKDTTLEKTHDRKRTILSTHRGYTISIPVESHPDCRFVQHEKIIREYHQYIDDYYQHSVNVMKHELAFPYHYSLIQMSRVNSSGRFIDRTFGKCTQWNRQIIHTRQPSSSFTMLQPTQRSILIGFSGITGLLITRLLGKATYWNRNTFQSMSTHIVRRTHSSTACEIMLNNRYSHFITEKNALRYCELKDVPIHRARRLLRVVYYDGHTLASLKTDIADFKRGKISIGVIYNNISYQYLYTYWIYCLTEAMHYHNQTDSERRKKCLPKETMFQRTKRIIRMIAEFSEMLSPDIVFITKTQRLAYTIKNTQIRLSNDGCYAAFLAFAKLEPSMIDDMLAPIIGTRYAGIMEEPATRVNWISSKDRVFGYLMRKHRAHIPRTANVNEVICRHNLVEKLIKNIYDDND